jgi:hypothetical protein
VRSILQPEKTKLSCRPKEYIFEYIVGARQAKNLAMTRGWGLDVCSIARSTFRWLAFAYLG